MEIVIMAGAAIAALVGTYVATNSSNGRDVVVQVKKAQKGRAKMKKALEK